MGWMHNMLKTFFGKSFVYKPIVCPDGAAGLGDFLKKLHQIFSRFIFNILEVSPSITTYAICKRKDLDF